MIKIPTSCKECDGRNFTWHCHPKNFGGVQDGRIRMHEIGVEFYLGCDDCSATLKIVDGDTVAGLLNDLIKN